jgi:hypothetical protein
LERAVCIRCGLLKKRTFATCPRCGLGPTSDNETQAKSIRLSTRYQFEDGEFQSVEKLRSISESIEAGRPYEFRREEIAALLQERRLLDRGLSARDVMKIVLYLLCLLAPTVFGIYWLLR